MNEDEIQKVQRKIPNWFNKPTQINSKILLNYLLLSNYNRKQVKKEDLENSCIDIQDFNGNYQQMKNSGENNHAQIFYEYNGYITLQNDIKDFIIEEYNKINDPLKQIIKRFIDKWDNTDGLWRMEFIEDLPRIYRGYKLSISFGQGKRQVPPKYPYISFLKDNNIVSNGVYPYIKYNYEDNTIYTSINYSNDNKPNYSNDILKKIESYEEFYFQKHDIDSLVQQINININEFEKIININSPIPHKIINTKNIILYGAPGIGKTHNYKKLISLIESGNTDKEIFDNITSNDTIINYDIDIPRNRVKFITFHQSYSYEDFIEGFRPSEDGNIKLEDGIFKTICNQAQQNLDDSKKDIKSLNNEKKSQNIFDNFVDSLLIQDKVELTNSVYINNIDDKAFYYTSNSNGMKNVKIPFDDIKEFINNNIQEQRDIKNLDNIMGTTRQRPNYPFVIYKKYQEFKKDNPNELYINIEQVEQKNYYLVIDEINRGNISKIFGELITLIEEDKRDNLEVVLPYSKKSFKIPSNLFIIATMNSTDKSIATIDIALRRRFTFLKMKPNPILVENKKARVLMKLLNRYIGNKENLGEDYMIGHSYFMKVKDDKDLEFIKEYKIKPLLEEYFYADDIKLEECKKILEL
jgi:5-methylcytosine-specific restriction protein B